MSLVHVLVGDEYLLNNMEGGVNNPPPLLSAVCLN